LHRRRPSGDDLDDWLFIYGGSLLSGTIHAVCHPYEPTDEQIAELEAELAEKQRRRRPLGFAPWPEHDGTDL
jgi:hypothetical protein